MKRSPFPRRWFGLQTKLTLLLLLVVMTPLGVSAYLIDQLGKVAASFGAGEAAYRETSMKKALDAYRELFDTTKRLHAEVADRLSHRPDLIALDKRANLAELLDQEPGLRRIELVDAAGKSIAHAEHDSPGKEWRDKEIDMPLGTAANAGTLKLTFLVPATLQDDYQELKQSIDDAQRLEQVRTALPESYQRTFLIVTGLAALGAALLGVILATFVTRRLGALITTARRVSNGKLEARVPLKGRDEMAELGKAFNTMLDDLEQTRSQIEYLQRIGAWQDVARRLAHEIKNPLTPIQLAMQQVVSTYKGDDARFKQQLTDAGEIVEEEIAGLRRLVDTFRTLGQLPKVEAAPIALDEVVSELSLDPTVAARLAIVPPQTPIVVRADKLLLKRVLANLVENGIHAGIEAGAAGDVVVGWTADARADAVLITVDDQGKGVSEDKREKIFEPYMTTKATGTGLGLAIARKIAIEHGGELSVSADPAPTGGARFIISLPLTGPESSRG